MQWLAIVENEKYSLKVFAIACVVVISRSPSLMIIGVGTLCKRVCT